MAFISFISVLTAIYNVWTQTKQNKVFTMCGILPGVMVWIDLFLVFKYSEWAWTHCGWVCLMITPTMGLINCRQIVCNCAK